MADYFRQEKAVVARELERLVGERVAVMCEVAAWRQTGYLLRADLGLVKRIAAGQVPLHLTALLSPFDNLIWDRARVKDLFDFEYKTQLYLAAKNRADDAGYYVMPIIHDGDLVGRIDPRMDRRTGTLTVKSIHLEPRVLINDRLINGIAGALVELMCFSRGAKISVGGTKPASLRSPLVRRIQAAVAESDRISAVSSRQRRQSWTPARASD